MLSKGNLSVSCVNTSRSGPTWCDFSAITSLEPILAVPCHLPEMTRENVGEVWLSMLLKNESESSLSVSFFFPAVPSLNFSVVHF